MNSNVIASGVVSGILYSIAAISLVIVYRSSRLINFALGGMGGLAAYIAYQFLLDGQSYILGYIAAIAAGMIVGWLTEYLIVRRLSGTEHIVAGIATLGVLLILQGVIILKWGTETQALPKVFGTSIAFQWGGLRVASNYLYIVAVAVVLLVLMYVLLRRTSLGLRMRATAEGEVTAALTGVNVRAVSRWSWVIGGAGGSISALLVIPTTTLAPDSFTNFLFFAFAAVVLGGLASTTSVIVGGVVFGVALNVIAYYLPSQITNTLSLIAVTIVLLLRPNGLLGVVERRIPQISGLRASGFRASRRRGEAATVADAANEPAPMEPAGVTLIPRRVPWPKVGGWAVLAIVLIALPSVANGGLQVELPAFSATILAVLSLTVLYGVAGKVSVGNGAFIGVGAYAAAILETREHIPFLISVLVAAVICFVVGGVVGLPALRVKSYVYFSVYTFMVANALPELVDYFSSWTGGENGLAISAPAWANGTPTEQYFFFLAVSAVVCGLVALLLRSRIGRRWRAARDSPLGAEAAGVHVPIATILAFAVSGALAGISGALQGAAVGIISPDVYTIWISVYLMVGVIVGGAGLIAGAVVGAAFITFVPYLSGSDSNISPDLIFGIVLILVISFAPSGVIVGAEQIIRAALRGLRRLWQSPARRQPAGGLRSTGGLRAASRLLAAGGLARWVPWRPDGAAADRATVTAGRQEPSLATAGKEKSGQNGAAVGRPPLLAVRSLSVAYDDLVALTGVNLAVREGEVVALLGPNGAGKSSTMRAIGGVARVRTGSIRFAGEEMVGLPPWAIARRGIGSVSEGRGIFPGLTVEENLTLGGLVADDRRRAQGETRALVFDSFPDLATRRRQLGGTLSGGQQQMLAIGRALMSGPKLLALDEPSLGLSPLLAAEVFESLASMKQAGTTMLLIEQNSALALELADSVCVLRDGAIQLACSAAEARSSTTLLAQYLGLAADRG